MNVREWNTIYHALGVPKNYLYVLSFCLRIRLEIKIIFSLGYEGKCYKERTYKELIFF